MMPLFFLLSGFALIVGYRSRLLPADSNTLHHLPQPVLPDEENTSNPLLESASIEIGTTEQPTHPVADETTVIINQKVISHGKRTIFTID